MAQNLGDVEMEDVSFEKRTFLSYGDVYRICATNTHMKTTSVTFAENILLNSGYLKIVDVKNSQCDIVQSEFTAAVDVVKKKMQFFKMKYLNKSDPKSRALVAREGDKEFHLFFDLEKYPALVDTEPSQQSSQGSSLADYDISVDSEIEKEVPSRPKNALKEFSKLKTKYKREKTNQAYKFLQNYCDEQNISYLDLVCYLGARGFYIDDKHLADTFDAVASGYRLPLKLGNDKSVYLKTTFADTQRLWNEFKWQFNGMINFPTYKNLNAHIEESMPTFIPYKNGWRFELIEVIHLTIQRLPQQVSNIKITAVKVET